MDFVLKMMNFVLKTMNDWVFCRWRSGQCSVLMREYQRGPCRCVQRDNPMPQLYAGRFETQIVETLGMRRSQLLSRGLRIGADVLLRVLFVLHAVVAADGGSNALQATHGGRLGHDDAR